MMLLLPFVEILPDDSKGAVYIGAYNYDPMFISSIEPDEDGDTCIWDKYGRCRIFKIPCMEFIEYIGQSESISIGFIHHIKKHDEAVYKRINKLLNKNS